MASQQFDKFKSTLRELFMLDQADLDFGIYRIMNQKRQDVEHYLNNRLPVQVKTLLEENASIRTTDLQKQLYDAIAQAQNLGVDPDTLPKVQELRKAILQQGSPEELENSVYSHLSTFFSRYYDGGDFISLRRYKNNVYAIPYQGEEVKLHWANADQYYIKTGEYFRTYSFKLNDGKKVEFTLKEATTEQNNNIAQNNMERRFALYEGCPIEVDGDTMHINFSYELYPKATKQKKLIEDAYNKVKDLIPAEFGLVLATRPTEKDRYRTLLQKHLNDYVAKNTFDYFIHKDLRGFLTRELDFYIKNEILFIDDINSRSNEEFLQHLTLIKAIKAVGQSLIAFLSQLEEFQKRLWLKKKFVIQADWCITLDRVPHELYTEICANDAQRAEWVRLFAIDEIKVDRDSGLFGNGEKLGYSEPLSVEFLEQNPYLVLDTAFFTSDFKRQLLSSIPDLDAQTDGLLVNSENFQALQLLLEKYQNKVDVVYIDPPYNTVHSQILYKNQFKHASWLSLINNTLPLVPGFWTQEFSFGLAIDDFEFTNLSMLLDDTFPDLEKSVVVVNHHPQGAGGRLSRTHEYYILISDSSSPQYHGEPKNDYTESRSFMRSGTSENNYRYGRPKSFYALLLDKSTNTIIGAEDYVPLDQPIPLEDTSEGYKRIYPINSQGEERVWRSSYLTGRERAKNGELTVSPRGTVYQNIDHEDKREVLFSNWTDSKYNAGHYGADILKDMGLGGAFDYPKSINTLVTGLWAQSFGKTDVTILDYFAGSGTTGHAVISMNRVDKGDRKYILVEMGNHFFSATKPRIEKVIYSKDWNDGKPVSREGSSHCFKYMRLEQYEDTLNNLTIDPRQTSAQGQFADGFLLGYLLDVETRDSLLNLEWFINPFDVKLNITRKNETEEERIDLPETFNYLIGLNVVQMSWPKPGIMVVEGTTRAGKKALIIWRDCNLIDNKALNEFFAKSSYSVRDNEFDIIYVNGDNNLENLRTDEDRWKVTLIEQEFNRKMFQ